MPAIGLAIQKGRAEICRGASRLSGTRRQVSELEQTMSSVLHRIELCGMTNWATLLGALTGVTFCIYGFSYFGFLTNYSFFRPEIFFLRFFSSARMSLGPLKSTVGTKASQLYWCVFVWSVSRPSWWRSIVHTYSIECLRPHLKTIFEFGDGFSAALSAREECWYDMISL